MRIDHVLSNMSAHVLSNMQVLTSTLLYLARWWCCACLLGRSSSCGETIGERGFNIRVISICLLSACSLRTWTLDSLLCFLQEERGVLTISPAGMRYSVILAVSHFLQERQRRCHAGLFSCRRSEWREEEIQDLQDGGWIACAVCASRISPLCLPTPLKEVVALLA